ncbi:hypothetical protein BDW42DRAFT_139754 [Aspergillus taichungensis]|uniref:Uncharacterized protein n=1 Tax=Aspergillus taichungensis TaxID=482145 RepID=A0A2J5HND8_9EURO|nr:hypothetical protein BDW42DRAFT_139754 [Aspergillus taichungensis]
MHNNTIHNNTIHNSTMHDSTMHDSTVHSPGTQALRHSEHVILPLLFFSSSLLFSLFFFSLLFSSPDRITGVTILDIPSGSLTGMPSFGHPRSMPPHSASADLLE